MKTLRTLVVAAACCIALPALAVDVDGDGTHDHKDNCVGLYNPLQLDADLDGFGNACDADFNNDGAVGFDDLSEVLGPHLGTWDAVRDVTGDHLIGLDDVSVVLGLINSQPGPSGLPCAGTVPCIACSYGVGSDTDMDAVEDDFDNCIEIANGPGEAPNDQIDWSSPPNGVGNACDGDFDEDGYVRATDASAMVNVIFGPDPVGSYDPLMDMNADGGLGFDDYGHFVSLYGSIPSTELIGPSGLLCPAGFGLGQPLEAGFPQASGSTIRKMGPDVAEGFVSTLLDAGHGYAPELTVAVTSQPELGRVVVEDSQTGRFRFENPAGSSTIDTVFRWVVTDGHHVSTEKTTRISLTETVETTPTAEDLNAATLVVYNENAAGSSEVADYYAQQRQIDPTHVCPVEMPPGLYATRDQMLSMRRQILEGCICPLLDPADQPSDCAAGGSLPMLASVSPITHLVFARGVPARLTGTGWPDYGAKVGDSGEPSLGFYLAYLLYRDEDIFCASCPGPAIDEDVDDSYGTFASYDYLPAISADWARTVVHGWIEAIDVERTKQLIDRTLAAEREGLTGNVLTTDSPRGSSFGHAARSRGMSDPACSTYSIPDDPAAPFETWPHEQCPVGTTYSEASPASSGRLPGSPNTHIPYPIAAGFYVGSDPTLIGQRGFNAFSTLRRWHRSEASCVELCDDLPAYEQAECRSPSDPDQFHDYFGELNPDCVGGARGLMGQQVRSYPVSHYGFWPRGWIFADTGHAESSVPRRVESAGAYHDSTFTDDFHLHYGERSWDDPGSSDCVTDAGTIAPCPEMVSVYLRYRSSLLITDIGDHAFTVTTRHRSRANAGGKLRVHLRYTLDDDSIITRGPFAIDLDQASPAGEWHESPPIQDVVTITGPSIVRTELTIETKLTDGVHDFLDLDGIELRHSFDGGPMVDLLPLDIGSFAHDDHHQTVLGDWAANAIDRLGAIAWWGSSSHHRTGGYAFPYPGIIYRRILTGRSLGEAVHSLPGGESGLVYGDPLYRPAGASLSSGLGYHALRPASGSYSAFAGYVVTPENLDEARRLYVSVLHGTNHLSNVQWEISICSQLDIHACDDTGGWVAKLSEQGAVFDREIDWTTLIDPAINQAVLIRLRVENANGPGDALYDYAFFDYQANP